MVAITRTQRNKSRFLLVEIIKLDQNSRCFVNEPIQTDTAICKSDTAILQRTIMML